MTRKDIENIRTYIAYYLSPYNEKGVDKKKIKELENLRDEIEFVLTEGNIVGTQISANLSNELKEVKKFRDIVPSTSLDTLKALNEKIDQITQTISDETLYSAETYFDTYFLQIGLSQKNSDVEDILNLVESSRAFKNWFEGSKVVDKDGNPLLVYHGRYNEEVTKFSFEKFPGRYFAENKSYAQWFAKLQGGEGILYSCFLRILNPMDLSNFGVSKVKYEDFLMYIRLKYGYTLTENLYLKMESDMKGGCYIWTYFRFGPDWIRQIIEDGKFDGIHFVENNPQEILPDGTENFTPAWMVFKNSQIKSAFGNILFDRYSEDFRFKEGGTIHNEKIDYKFGGL